MDANPAFDLVTLYHLTEDHYFAATCLTHRRYCAAINAYFIDEHDFPWNLLFIRLGSAPLGEEMAAALELIRRTPIEVRLVIHEQKIEGLGEVLTGLDFHPAEKTTAMVLQLSALIPSEGEGDVHVRLTRDLNEWAVPLGNAYAMLPEVVAHYQARHQRALDADESLYHFTLCAEGQVSCSLTLSLCNGEARLNDVGTLINLRGRGYATRLIREALHHASSLGALRCFLEASEGAVPLYRKLGFERLFDYRAFVRVAVPGL